MHRGRAELAYWARIFPAVSLFRSFDIEPRHQILVRPEKSITVLLDCVTVAIQIYVQYSCNDIYNTFRLLNFNNKK